MDHLNTVLEIDNQGVWKFIHAGRVLFSECTLSLWEKIDEEYPKPVYSGSCSGEGRDILGAYTCIVSEFSLFAGITVKRTVKLYSERQAVLVTVDVENNCPDRDFSLCGITLMESRLCLEAEGSRFLTNDWERYYGVVNLEDTKEAGMVYSAWNMGIWNKRLEAGIAAGVLSGRTMFASIGAGRHNSGDMSFKAYGDVRSGDSGVVIPPGGRLQTDGFLIVAGSSPYSALDGYSSLVMNYNGISPKEKRAAGWADWYYYYGNNSEETVLENLEAIDKRLGGYGIEYIQVDDGWQEIKSYVRYEPLDITCTTSCGAPWEVNADFKSGMKELADRIHSKGYKAGLWIRPFSMMEAAGEYRQNKPWVLKHAQQDEMPDRATIDISNDEAVEWLGSLFKKIACVWGYDFIKYDFITYDILSVRDFSIPRQQIGAMRITNRQKTSAAAYYNAISAFRKNVPEDTFLLGCNCLSGSAIGVVDGFRVSGDVCIFSWELTKKMLVSAAYRYYMNGKLWQNDPDVVMAGEKISKEKAVFWASFVALSGGMVLLGDCIPLLSEERIGILKKILPVYEGSALPLRLFEEEYPAIWSLRVEKPFGRWHVVGVYNWEDKRRELSFSFGELGLKSDASYLLFDFWMGSYLGAFSKGYTCSLDADSCRVLSVREAKGVPQVLSTQYHISQGGNELVSETWDESALSLTVAVAGIPGTRMKIWIYIPEGFRTASVESCKDIKLSHCCPGEAAALEWEVNGQGVDEICMRFKK